MLMAGLLLLPTTTVRAQSSAWQRAVTFGLGSGYGTAVDAAGNAYVTGEFAETITFGAITLSSAGGTDVYVAKFDPAGVCQWAVRAGGTSNDTGGTLAVAGNGNVLIGGSFDSPAAQFGSNTLTNSAGGPQDLFVASLSAAGAWQWATGGGGGGYESILSLTVDSGGDVYVAGRLGSLTATFGAITLTNAGFQDVFVGKLSAAGVWRWANNAGGTAGDVGTGIAVDQTGNVYLTGIFSSSTIALGATVLTNAGNANAFVARLTPAGAWQWAVGLAGPGVVRANWITVDNGGNAFVLGDFNCGAPFTLGTTTLTDIDGDVFVGKLTPTGTWAWATSAGGPGREYGYGITLDAAGDAYLTGAFGSPSATFGATTLPNATPVTSNYTPDVFVAKLTNAGAWRWAAGAGGAQSETGYAVAVNGSAVYVCGDYNSPTSTFGSINLPGPRPRQTEWHTFLARLDARVLGVSGTSAGAATFSAWPNPSPDGRYQLRGADTGALTVLDALGRVVMTKPAPVGTSLDLSALPPGFYVVRNGAQTARLVRE